MEITIDNIPYTVQETKEKITIADSFVVGRNKIGGGHGEGKLYIGNDNAFTRSFFGDEGFNIKCFLLKADLIKYLEETKAEYLAPEQPYVHKEELPKLWEKRKEEIEKLPNIIYFTVAERYNLAESTFYLYINKLVKKNLLIKVSKGVYKINQQFIKP